MDDEELVRAIAHFWSEWTDDSAPVNERGIYTTAARDFLVKFDVAKKDEA